MRWQLVAVGIAAGCGRVGFDAAPIAQRDVAADAPDAFALDEGFPIVANDNRAEDFAISTPPITVGPRRLLVAVFVWGTGGTDESPLAVNSPSLTWTRQVYSTFPAGSVPPGTSGDGIWTAETDAPLTAEIVTGTRGSTAPAILTLGVYAFTGAKVGASGTHADQAGQTALLVEVPTAPGELIVGGFHHGEANAIRMPNASTQWDVTDDPTLAPNGHSHAIGRLIGTSPGGTITLGSATPGPYSLTSGLAIAPR